ncbi:alkaline phosphatase family protein [Pseudooceanicola sp. CBS1P-1]|uniref:Sulfatase-like hydrolase/transferase n=1 Tax=Pseudooceanicola albus TaxID=2692189 RepID=A0A6L7G0H8_9RHOB|nr:MULTISPECIES: alkaline phosphatase family protein [Pseudooceanicola]MBT9382335.1 alkaline phosphatase family protein [Pseudooceanicola endophyticus]MXN16877.1 sulfatase-like hydrolase/transferase [Pseudooceanicola albus]
MTQPNVLMIVVDQWRADVLSKLGTEHIRTPNIDRLCAEGVTFANHVTVTCPCGPARASLMTGLYASNHGVVQNSLPLDRRHATLAGELRKVGYDPALIGYSTSVPDPRGLSTNDPRFRWLGDVMEGFRPIASFEPEKEAYFGWVSRQGFPLPANRDDIWLPEGDATPGPTDRPARIPAPLSDTAFFTEAALTYLEGRTPERPFFLHLGYWRPHPPFVASAPYNDMYDPADMPGPLRAPSPREEGAQHPLLAHHLRTNRSGDYFQGAEGLAADLSDDEIRQTRATYYGLVTEIDDHLGRIFAQLDRAGIWDDTLIVFTSDHGEQLGDHHLLGKTCYHDQSFRVPLVIKDPRRKSRAGEIETAFTESIDVMPTILDWLGGSVPHTVDGHSLLPFLESGRPEGWREALHYEFDSRDAFGREHEAALGVGQHEAGLCVIQDGDWKYVHFTAMPPLLFDLKNDPGQFINLAEDPAHADTLRIYAQKMLSWRMRHADRTLTVFQSNPEGFLDRRSSH